MADPQFIPSGLPHSVEMPDGSSLAKSKSRKVGDDVRRTEEDPLEAGQIDVDHIVRQAKETALGQTPRADKFQRADDATAPNLGPKSATADKAPEGRTRSQVIYDTAMEEIDFPARFIQLKINNDLVRAELQVLASQLGDDN